MAKRLSKKRRLIALVRACDKRVSDAKRDANPSTQAALGRVYSSDTGIVRKGFPTGRKPRFLDEPGGRGVKGRVLRGKVVTRKGYKPWSNT